MQLVINDTNITTDQDGRYSLNDLHKSSGGLLKDKPAKFMRTDSFANVVEILKGQNRTFNPVVKKQGRYNGGTWVCGKELNKYKQVKKENEAKWIESVKQAQISFGF